MTPSKLSNKFLRQQNERHKYFLDSMRLMLAVMEPNFADTSSKEGATKKPSGNRFELLETLDEPLIQGGAGESETSPQSVRARTTSDGDETDRDWLLRAYFTFKDFNDIRAYVQSVWQDYKAGKVDLIVAAMVTETAFHAMDELEKKNLYPTVGGRKLNPQSILLQFYRMIDSTRGLCNTCADEVGPMWDILRFRV